MTTDHDLLARIESYQNNTTESAILISALRAVVELHKPNPDRLVEVLYGDKEFFVEKEPSCNFCYDKHYPCPTIQAIEKELG